MVRDDKTGAPVIGVWMGNFYSPAFDDGAYIQDTVGMLAELGFNSIELDVKAWEDLRDRYAGGAASQYVWALERTMQAIRENGLSYMFLALYLNADNLYPNIRFSPPIYGESVVKQDGGDGKWYRYWSEKAQDSMMQHIQGLFRTWGDDVTTVQEKRPLLCSMWDPIVAPSFDEEGRKRYLDWLRAFYEGDINALNAAYGSCYPSFDALGPEEYWSERSAGPRWIDNQRWRMQELVLYFAAMQRRLKTLDKNLCLCPMLTQWSYFLNIDGASLLGAVGFSDLWDTAMRGIDPFAIAPYVDMTHFLAVPVTATGDPDAYVLAAQHAMLRAMNRGRDFLGGVYWGRYLYNDLYATLTPGEMVGSMVAAGAGGYLSYGVCGMDDGGLLDRMPEGFLKDLQAANAWAKQVIPLLGGRKTGRVAILFPQAMAAYEPLSVPGNPERREDLLGWFRLLCDGGYTPEIVTLEGIRTDGLAAYTALVLPANSQYEADADRQAEMVLRSWTERGGIVLHGPGDMLAMRALDIVEINHENDCFCYADESGIPQGKAFAAYPQGEPLAVYLQDKETCMGWTPLGLGGVVSIGFLYGTNYVAKSIPHVPAVYRNSALYPVSMLHRQLPLDLLAAHAGADARWKEAGLECAAFENGYICVNHTAYPKALPKGRGMKYHQQMDIQGVLPPRSAVFVETKDIL